MQRVAALPPLTVHDHLNFLLERGSGWMVGRVTEGDMLLFIKAFTSNTHHPLFICWQACLTLTGWGAVIAAMCVLTLDVVLNKWACLFMASRSSSMHEISAGLDCLVLPSVTPLIGLNSLFLSYFSLSWSLLVLPSLFFCPVPSLRMFSVGFFPVSVVAPSDVLN